MNYKVNRVNNRYEILETQTDQVVYTTPSDDKAKNLCRDLNLGGFFDGQTPAFFLTQIPRPTFNG
jgi:hypothetical protein